MFGDSKIEADDRSLSISLSTYGAGRMALMELIGAAFGFWVVHQIATSDVAERNQIILLIYILPLFPVWRTLKRLKSAGEQYCFDRQLNELTLDGIRKCKLDDIEAVEINYDLDSDPNRKYLELKLQGARKIRIRDFGSKKTLVNDGREIAKFLKIKMMDNFPHGRELLWGEADADFGSISHLNEHIRPTDSNTLD